MSSFLSTHLGKRIGIYVAIDYGQFSIYPSGQTNGYLCGFRCQQVFCPPIWVNNWVFMWLHITFSFLSPHLGKQMGIYVATNNIQFSVHSSGQTNGYLCGYRLQPVFCPPIWANKWVFMCLQIMASFLSTYEGCLKWIAYCPLAWYPRGAR